MCILKPLVGIYAEPYLENGIEPFHLCLQAQHFQYIKACIRYFSIEN